MIEEENDREDVDLELKNLKGGKMALEVTRMGLGRGGRWRGSLGMILIG